MLGWLVRRRLAAFERAFDYDVSYWRDIHQASPRACSCFSKIVKISNYREDVPGEAWYAAKLAAALTEDCGSCTQLVVKMAEREGMSPAAIRAVVLGEEGAMPPDTALGFRFAQAVLRRDIAESDRLRREIVTRWGKKALVSLALDIASARVYPSVKYALGYGHTCTKVSLAGTEIAVRH
jgi:hypothetical protein